MGRLRSVEAHRRALEAASEVVSERGLEGLTVDEVSVRSGVAKTTIYRHWPNRVALARDAFRSRMAAMPTPNSGDLRSDLLEYFDALVAASAVPQTRCMIVALLHAASQDPALQRLHVTIMEERTRPVRTILQLAQARRELPADLDLDLVVDLLVGPPMFRLLVRGEELDRVALEAVIDCVLVGLAASTAAPLTPSA